MFSKVVITVATDVRRSAAFKVPPNCEGLLVYIPTIDNAAVQLEVYTGTPPASADASVLAADQDTGWSLVSTNIAAVSTGDKTVRFNPVLAGGLWCRIYTGAGQSANRTFLINLHGVR